MVSGKIYHQLYGSCGANIFWQEGGAKIKRWVIFSVGKVNSLNLILLARSLVLSLFFFSASCARHRREWIIWLADTSEEDIEGGKGEGRGCNERWEMSSGSHLACLVFFALYSLFSNSNYTCEIMIFLSTKDNIGWVGINPKSDLFPV